MNTKESKAMQNQIKKKTKPASLLLSIIQTVLIIALVGVAILSFGTRVPFLANLGFNFFAVTSGSMEPKLPVGSLIYSGKYRLDMLKVGDIITYQKTGTNSKPTIVTHRIFSIDKKEEKQTTEENGKKGEKTVVTYTIKTKGDANNVPDDYTVEPGEIIGLYRWNIPKLGYISMFAQQPLGFITLVIVPAAILIVWEVISLILYFKNHYEQKHKDEMEKMRKEFEGKVKTENA